jgi:hypothetical protein
LDELQDSYFRIEHDLGVDVERDASEDWARRTSTDGQLQGKIGVRRDNNEADLGGSASGTSVSVSEAIAAAIEVRDSVSHIS